MEMLFNHSIADPAARNFMQLVDPQTDDMYIFAEACFEQRLLDRFRVVILSSTAIHKQNVYYELYPMAIESSFGMWDHTAHRAHHAPWFARLANEYSGRRYGDRT